jgi:hypothetical protein
VYDNHWLFLRISPVASKKRTKELSEKKPSKEEKLYARKSVSLLELLEASADNNEKELKAQQDDSAIFSGSSAEREIVTTKKVPLRHQKSIVISLEDNYEDKMANEIQPKRLFGAGRVTRPSDSARVLRSSTKTTKK